MSDIEKDGIKKLPDTLHSEPGVNLNRTMNKMKKTIS